VCEWILKQDRSRWTNVYLTFSKKIFGGRGVREIGMWEKKKSFFADHSKEE
jgi:hypothetical protein